MKKEALLMIVTMFCACLGVPAQQKDNRFRITYSSAKSSAPIISRYNFSDTLLPKEVYLKKSKTQLTVGWAMLGGGVAMTVAGGVLFSNNFELFSNKNDTEAATGGVLFLTGIGCSLGSIPFFISSGHNARKAAAISFNNNKMMLPQQNNFVAKAQPTITVTIKL